VAPDRPLAGRRVLVPRPPHQASALSARIRQAGGTPVEAATIATVPGDLDGLADAVRGLARGRFAGVCLTSGNGVRAVADACERSGLAPADALDGVGFVAAVGPRTAELVGELLGVEVDLLPPTSTSASLGAVLSPGTGEVLLPRGDLASTDLDRQLATAGYTPRPVVAYRTVTAAALPDEVVADLGRLDLLAFTSASTVRGFVQLVAAHPWSGRVVAIGPVTAAACRTCGLEVAAVADPHDLDGLLDALVRAASG
jgi:uroporphyrinogen-III synthase